jgi:hypothetical protein
LPTKKRPVHDKNLIGTRVRDLTGDKIGTFIVKQYMSTKPQGSEGKLAMAEWEVECTLCGNIEVKTRRRLVAGTAKCSRCHRRVRKDLTSKRFGRWTVVALAATPPDGYAESYWQCRCDCGTWRVVRRGYLTSGDSNSCGCLFDDVNARVMRKARKARWARARRRRKP